MPHVSRDKFEGCVLGLALGDALGAPYEGRLPERLVWRLIGTTRSGRMRWSDDTQMTLDVMNSLLAKGKVDPDDLATRFARGYRWSRGYGPGTAKVLKRIARGDDWRAVNTLVHAEGSFGNGAAMRAPVIGLFYAGQPAEMEEAVRMSARVTHAHPLGIEGALLVARASAGAALGEASAETLDSVIQACRSDAMAFRSRRAREWLAAGREPSAGEVRRHLGNGVAAAESCVTAIYLAMRFRDGSFSDLVRFVVSMGGDTDTIAAMAGAVWGAANGSGALPQPQIEQLEDGERITQLAGMLFERL